MPPEPTVIPLSDTTTAYLQLPGGWFLNNGGWISGSERTLLVDACATEDRTRRLRSTLGAVPELSVVFTHSHADHVNGAGLIAAPDTTFYATPAATTDIAAGPQTYSRLIDCDDWGHLLPPPEVAPVTDTARMDLGDHTVEVIPAPHHAHTAGDLVVWSSHDRVLFTGDLLFHGVTPLALNADVRGWLSVLDWIDTFPAQHLVPGHGPVLRANDQPTDGLRIYFRWLLDATSAARPDFDRLVAHARARWPDWLDAERHVVNLHATHGQQHGLPHDPASLIAILLQTTGGPIPVDLRVEPEQSGSAGLATH